MYVYTWSPPHECTAPLLSLAATTMPTISITNDALEYDFLILGGGTSGCALAGRLAQTILPDGTPPSILLVEAGPDSRGLQNVEMVGGLFSAFGTPLDWNFETIPQPGLNGRVVKLNRGKFLGGCSGFNGTLCIRGAKTDYDDWELEGWSGEEVFGLMKRAERFHPKRGIMREAEGLHGDRGPVDTELHESVGIVERLLESFEGMGLDRREDMFTTGESISGCGHVVRTVRGGKRSTSTGYLGLEGVGERLDVVFETVVDRVLVESVEGELVGVGAVILGKDGVRRRVKARKEAVVCAGTYCSPGVLMRSGIGGRTELELLGIECLVDSPGVGKNLLDHLVVFTPYEVNKPGLTNDCKLWHGNAAQESLKEYQEKKSGFFSTFPFGAHALCRLDERLKGDNVWEEAKKQGRALTKMDKKLAHIEYMQTELYTQHGRDMVDMNGKHGFDMMTLLFSQQSVGTVTLKSSDPLAPPVIDPNYLEDPLDIVVLAEGCKYGNEIVMEGQGTRDIVLGSLPPGDNHHAFTEREQWVEHVRKWALTAYHPVGTCKMGHTDNPKAVVDEKLQVRGVKRLRVADCSVMPTLNGGHTQMPA